MKTLFLFIFAMFFATSYADNQDCKIIDQIQQEFISQSLEKYELYCLGDRASFPKKLESIGAIFGTDRVLSVDESRLLIVNLVNDFQILINKSDKIKPLLSDSPFPADRINISIRMSDGNKLPPPDEFSSASTSRGNIFYSTLDLDKSIFDQTEIKESLEEACEKTGISISLIRSTYSDYGKKRRDIEPIKSAPK